MSRDEKVLVIGSGPVGATALFTLTRLGYKNILLSSHSEGKIKKQNLFGQNIPTSHEGVGGLGKYWHSVCDLGLLKQVGFLPTALSLECLGNTEFIKSQEFVPFRPLRPNRLLRKSSYKLRPPVVKLASDQENVLAYYLGGEEESFDRVLVCHGAIPELDCLVNSDLAQLSPTVSDHLVAQVQSVDKELFLGKKEDRVFFSAKGFRRSYVLTDKATVKYKITARPNYDLGGERALHLDKGIYVGSSSSIIGKLIKRGSYSLIRQSLFLRYGLFRRSNSWTGFINILAKDCYKREGSQLVVDEAKLEQLRVRLEEEGLRLTDDSLMSGIHYHNTYKSLSPKVGNNQVSDQKIILIAPNYDFDVGAEHFTFRLMMMAENIVEKLGDV